MSGADGRHAHTVETAMALATEAHAGQLDKGGRPYIEHPLGVMERVSAAALPAGVERDLAQMAAVLHDVVEDTVVTLADLRARGYPERVVRAVDALTHRDGEQVRNYLTRVAADPIALVVKRADMADNGDPARLSRLPAGDAARYERRYLERGELLERLAEASGSARAGGDGRASGVGGSGAVNGTPALCTGSPRRAMCRRALPTTPSPA